MTNNKVTNNPLYKSLGLPPIDQIGFVVRDLDAWVARYEPMFGPFTFIDGSVQQADYRGRKADVSMRIGFGRSGNLEIEFIECTAGESPHMEFIKSGREGMHHVRFRVDDCAAWIKKMEAFGYRSVWHKVWTEDTEFVYMEREGDPTFIEFLQMPAAPAEM